VECPVEPSGFAIVVPQVQFTTLFGLFCEKGNLLKARVYPEVSALFCWGPVPFNFYCLSYTCCVFTSFPSILALVFTVTVFPSSEMAVETVPIFAPPFFNTPDIW